MGPDPVGQGRARPGLSRYATAHSLPGRPPVRIQLLALLLLGSLVAGSRPAHAERRQLTVQEQYELGLKYLKRGYYVKALEQFNRVRNYYRDDPFAVKAELAIGDVYFEKREWDQARLAYEDFMRMHPRHAELDYVVYRVGLSNYKKAPKAAGRDQTWTRQAVNAWSGFDARFPESTYRDDVLDSLDECRERLARRELLIAEFYVRRGAWGAVEGRADGMLRTYPDSRYAADGLFLLGEASAWNGEADRARSIADRLAELEPAEGDRLRARIDDIETDLAERAAGR